MFAAVASGGAVLADRLPRGVLEGSGGAAAGDAGVEGAEVAGWAGVAEGGLVAAVDVHGPLGTGVIDNDKQV